MANQIIRLQRIEIRGRQKERVGEERKGDYEATQKGEQKRQSNKSKEKKEQVQGTHEGVTQENVINEPEEGKKRKKNLNKQKSEGRVLLKPGDTKPCTTGH